MESERVVRLFRNGRNQALRIPREFELPGTEAVLRKDGNRLILEPANQMPGLLAVLAALKPITDDDAFADIDAGLLPIEDVLL